jgi:GT2 family glycosyltransferase
MTRLRLSVIIVSYNTIDYLRRCLVSLGTYQSSWLSEVIVVDNASTDGSAEMVAAEFPWVRLVRRARNDGYGVALNNGVLTATGGLLMFLNPDIEVREESVDHLCAFVADHPQAGVVGPRLEQADGQPQASAKHFCSAWRLALEASRLPLLLPKTLRSSLLLGTYFDQAKTRRVSWISGACHVVPKAVWDDVGELTEETFCGFDDYDYCFRARAKGYDVWLDAESAMTHHCSIAVKDRWSEWEVEQVAIHNTYVVLESHWARWRIKCLLIAELMTYGAEWARLKASPRRHRSEQEYAHRLGLRLNLLGALLTGRRRAMRRFGETSVECSSAPLPLETHRTWRRRS